MVIYERWRYLILLWQPTKRYIECILCNQIKSTVSLLKETDLPKFRLFNKQCHAALATWTIPYLTYEENYSNNTRAPKQIVNKVLLYSLQLWCVLCILRKISAPCTDPRLTASSFVSPFSLRPFRTFVHFSKLIQNVHAICQPESKREHKSII